MNLWSWLTQRSVIGSDAVILWAMGVHAYDAWLFAFDSSSWGSIGMTALLRFSGFFGGSARFAIAALVISILLAAIGQWWSNISPYWRLGLLMPQMLLFLVTSFGGLFAALHGSYVDCVRPEDCVYRSHNYIGSDQIQRIGFPYLYAVAAIARARAEARSRAARRA